MDNNRYGFKKKLKENSKPSIGTWLTLGNQGVAEMMANAGYEWITIDLEHSSMSLSDCLESIRTIDRSGSIPLVRLSDNDSVQIKRVMDAGARGIIVPMVKSLEDVQAAYQGMHYPPLGNRGVGLARAQAYGPGFRSYMEWLKNESVLIVQIEHIDAVNELDKIFSSEMVDAYIVGPYDLTASMGKPGQFDDPDFLEAMKKIEEAGKKYNKAGGLHVVEPDLNELKKTIDKGLNFIAYSVDFRFLDSGLRSCSEFLN